jgi:hypothetical protein
MNKYFYLTSSCGSEVQEQLKQDGSDPELYQSSAGFVITWHQVKAALGSPSTSKVACTCQLLRCPCHMVEGHESKQSQGQCLMTRCLESPIITIAPGPVPAGDSRLGSQAGPALGCHGIGFRRQ